MNERAGGLGGSDDLPRRVSTGTRGIKE